MPASNACLPCRIEAPPSFIPKARYAVATLLRPLGLSPEWVGDGAAPAGLYYGTDVERAPAGWLSLRLAAATPRFFKRFTPLDPAAVRWATWEGEAWPVLFEGGMGEEGDLLASAFFWLSGWQEHASPERDRHGRFPYEASLQAALGLAVRPPVDAYRERLAVHLRALGVEPRRRTWGGAAWAVCPTHDVDYLRKWRVGIVYRELVHHLLLNRRGVGAGGRVHRLAASARQALAPGDPCRAALVRMQAETAARGGTATFFFKAGAGAPFDVPYPIDAPFLRARFEALGAGGFEVGLHPSYRAHDRADLLAAEREKLEAAAGRAPRSVRQHYLRYALPATPRLHERLGFEIDSTLGFATQEGFRWGTCVPFLLYDPEANRELATWEMPLAVMESTLFNHRRLGPDGARTATEEVLGVCRRYGGVAVGLWHNTLWDELDYPGWGRHFTDTLDAAQAGGARIASLSEALDAWLAET